MKTKAMHYLNAFKAALELMQSHVAHQPPGHLDVDALRISRGLVTTCRDIKDAQPDDETPGSDA